jgi:tetratricopeptide (TPR) repeat protein
VSSISPVAPQPTAEADPVPNDAWYLHSPGRRFGPLTEDEMRGYFRAGMVKINDSVAVAGQVGLVPSAQAATLLGMAPPAPGEFAVAPVATSIIVTERREHGIGGLVALGVFVGLVGIAYFSLHKPATLDAPTTSASAEAAPAFELAPAQQVAPSQSPAQSSSPDFAIATSPGAENAPAVDSVPATQVIAAEGVRPTVTEPTAPTDSWRIEAQRLLDASDWTALKDHAGKWAAAESGRDMAWWYLGIANAKLENWAAAIDAYQHALAITPNHFKVRWALAASYMNSQHYRESADLLNALVKEDPGTPLLWRDLGVAMSNLGEYDESIAALQKATQLDPANRQTWADLGQTYAHFGYMDKAREAIAHANAR